MEEQVEKDLFYNLSFFFVISPLCPASIHFTAFGPSLLSFPLQADISLIQGSHALHPPPQSSWGLINRHAVLMFYCL